MRFVTFLPDGADPAGGQLVGVVDGEQVLGLPAGTTLLGLLRTGQLHERGKQAFAQPDAVHRLRDVRLLAPLPDPPTVRDFMTFEEHVVGTMKLVSPGAGVPEQWYAAPAFYFTNPYAILGPADDVPLPPGCLMFDLELEVAAVVGRAGRDLSPEDAQAHIAGFTILVDWSARDVQLAEMQVRLGPTKGKDTATTLGPVLVTADELEPFRSGTSFRLAMTASVNGEPIGSDRLSSMAFSFGDMVAYASRGTEVRPGDVLGSGTCGGGCLAELWGRRGLDAHPPLQPGDVIAVEVEQLGAMSLRIAQGVAPVPIAPARRGPASGG